MFRYCCKKCLPKGELNLPEMNSKSTIWSLKAYHMYELKLISVIETVLLTNHVCDRGYLLFLGEYQIYFIECVENSDVSNTQDEIYLMFTKKKIFFFYFILFQIFTVNRVTMLRTKRQRIVCDRIPGSIKLKLLRLTV